MRTALRIARTAGVIGCLCIAVAIAGCSSPPLEPGKSEYSGGLGGTLTAVEKAPYGKTVAATKAAMDKLAMRPSEQERDAFRSFIVGEATYGALSQTHEVRVWVTRLTDETTQIEMRIMGRRDEERLRVVLAEIQKSLGTKAN